jgi:DNA-binding phage protein
VNVHAAFAAFHPADPPDPEDLQSLAAWLKQLRGKTSIATLASQSGYSRHQLGRWLSAHAEPRLPEFLATVEAMTGRVSDLVAALVPIELVAELHSVHTRREAARKLAYEEPWTEAILRVIEAQSYAALDKHVPGFIADLLGIDRATEERCLSKLLSAGVIRSTAGRYRPLGSLTVDTRSTAALKAHWTRTALERVTQPGADDFFGYNVFSASHEDMARIRELLRATYREIRTILSATRVDEHVALINLQLLCWPRSR